MKEARKKNRFKHSALDRRKSRQLLIMCIPSILKVFIFSYLPMIGLVMAFQFYIPRRGLFNSPFVGFENFSYLLKSSIATRLITNSIVFNLLFIITTTIVSLLLGLFLFQISSKIFVKVSQVIIIFPYFLSWPLVGVLLSALLGSQTGIITNALQNTFGIRIDFYAKPDLWRMILTVVDVWKISGLSAVVFFAVLLGVDKEIYEAADIDGCGKFRKMWSISMPYLKQMIVVNTLMSSANILRMDFNMVYFLTNNSPTLYPKTDVIETYMFRALRTEGDFSIATATGLIQGVVGLVLTLILNALSKRFTHESLY